MAKNPKKPKAPLEVDALTHTEAKRRNIPTAEHESVIGKTEAAPKEVRYKRNTDLDPQLMWRGKDYQDWTDLVVQAPPLYIQEKIQPKALDDLMEQSKTAASQAAVRKSISSATSTAFQKARRRRSSTRTIRTGRTA